MSRTSIFVAALSGAVVALALVAQATDFDGAFVAFALVLLPVVYFLGVVRVARLGQVNLEDSRWMQGMNRIRDAYLEFAPELEPFAEVCPESSVALGAVRSPRSTRRRGTPSRATRPGAYVFKMSWLRRAPRLGPGTNSTSSRRRWLLRFGMSAAITGFLSLFVRASSGGFSLQ
jgi:hypothetical protein